MLKCPPYLLTVMAYEYSDEAKGLFWFRGKLSHFNFLEFKGFGEELINKSSNFSKQTDRSLKNQKKNEEMASAAWRK